MINITILVTLVGVAAVIVAYAILSVGSLTLVGTISKSLFAQREQNVEIGPDPATGDLEYRKISKLILTCTQAEDGRKIAVRYPTFIVRAWYIISLFLIFNVAPIVWYQGSIQSSESTISIVFESNLPAFWNLILEEWGLVNTIPFVTLILACFIIFRVGTLMQYLTAAQRTAKLG